MMGIHRPYYEREAFAQFSPAQAAEAYKGSTSAPAHAPIA